MIIGVAQTSVLCTAAQLGLRHVLTLSGKVHDEQYASWQDLNA